MASSLDPRIIVLALGAGALGFPDALRYLLDIAGRSPLLDIAICVFAMAVVTAHALGAVLLARFVRKAQARAGDDDAPAPRTDRLAQVTLVVSLAVASLVSACLLAASGAGARGLALLHLVAGVVAKEMKSPVIAVLATATAAAAAASSSTGTGRFRFASMARRVASVTFTGAAAFLLAVSGGLYMRGGRGGGSLAGAAAFMVTTLVVLLLTRKARDAAGAGGGRAAPASTSTSGDSAS